MKHPFPLAFIALALAASCAIQPSASPVIPTLTRHLERNYELGVTRSAYVGEQVVQVREGFGAIRPNAGANLQNFDIIFTGIDATGMRFTYREFTSDDLARPAFFQDLSYPVGAETLRFRAITIRVDGATAQQITYTVLSDGLVASEPHSPSDAEDK